MSVSEIINWWVKTPFDVQGGRNVQAEKTHEDKVFSMYFQSNHFQSVLVGDFPAK